MRTEVTGLSCKPREHSSPQRAGGKNHIYLVNHIVPKPASHMAADEYELLKDGGEFMNTKIYCPQYKTLESVDNEAGVNNDSRLVKSRYIISEGTREESDQIRGDVSTKGEATASYKISSMRYSLIGRGLASSVYMGTIIAHGNFPRDSIDVNGGAAPNEVLPYKMLPKYHHPIGCAIKVFRRTQDSLRSFERELKAVSVLKNNDRHIVNFLCAALADVSPSKTQYTPVSIFFSPHDPQFDEAINALKSQLTSKLDSTLKRPLIFYEFTGTTNLWQWICEKHEIVQKVLWCRWGTQLSTSLEYLHSLGIIHQDIKPHNIVVGDNMDLKLVDFGDSYFLDNAGGSHVGSEDADGTFKTMSPNSPSSDGVSPAGTTKLPLIVDENLGKGTFAYKAPELITRDPILCFSPAVDVYALGVTLWVMMSGKAPFAAANSEIQMLAGISRGFFTCGMQTPSNATPEVVSSDPTHWNLHFPTGEPAGIEIQSILASTLSVNPSTRCDASQLLLRMLKLSK